MEFSTGIVSFDRTYNYSTIDRYNEFLKNNSSFTLDGEVSTDFEKTLEVAQKNYPLHDKQDPIGLGNFADQIGNVFNNSINAVNNARLEADRMQEDIAMGGSTNIHDAMIAAEKASLSMQMAVQVRNRIIAAYNDITGMMI